MDKTLIHASVSLQADRYNHTLKATVPGCWVLRLDFIPAALRVRRVNVVPEFYGNTKQEAIQNACQAFRDLGLSGSLRLH